MLLLLRILANNDFPMPLSPLRITPRFRLVFSKAFVSSREKFDLILEIMSLCIEDIIKIKCESENLCKLTPYLRDLKDVEPEFSVEALCEYEKEISEIL